MASLEAALELGASNPGDEMDDHITALCGFQASTCRTTSTATTSEDSMRSEAMEQALSDVALIANSAAEKRPKVTRSTFKDAIRRFLPAAGKAAAVCDGPGPVCFAIIHAKNAEQVIENVQIVVEEGAAGVFIINHDFDYPQVLPILRQVRGRYPDVFVGVNFHTLNGAEAFPILGRLAREGIKIDAYWADNACIDHTAVSQPSAEQIASTRQKSAWDGLYFGGTAFKNPKQHQKLCAPVPVECLTEVAEAASRYMDVVTTSGPQTGVAPETTKIELMRRGCLDTPLCVASGVGPDNVELLFEDVDCVFAATSIQSDGNKSMLDRTKLRALLSKIAGQ
eukprot:Tamp_17640.p1 GENE.Tamp_17640~~Tamp_17640.p1  ORF type:complete len:338 (-),score=55.72 Tamp_17640:116-1129(-)